MRMKGFVAGICILAVLAATDAAAQKRLTIIHVNDTHSHLEPERAGEEAGLGGVIERAAYRDSEGAKEAMVSLYGLSYGEGSDYATLDEAYAAMTGFDMELARKELRKLGYLK